jgi:hypothetical protein
LTINDLDFGDEDEDNDESYTAVEVDERSEHLEWDMEKEDYRYPAMSRPALRSRLQNQPLLAAEATAAEAQAAQPADVSRTGLSIEISPVIPAQVVDANDSGFRRRRPAQDCGPPPAEAAAAVTAAAGAESNGRGSVGDERCVGRRLGPLGAGAGKVPRASQVRGGGAGELAQAAIQAEAEAAASGTGRSIATQATSIVSGFAPLCGPAPVFSAQPLDDDDGSRRRPLARARGAGGHRRGQGRGAGAGGGSSRE